RILPEYLLKFARTFIMPGAQKVGQLASTLIPLPDSDRYSMTGVILVNCAESAFVGADIAYDTVFEIRRTAGWIRNPVRSCVSLRLLVDAGHSLFDNFCEGERSR